MTSHVGRLYATAVAILAFFLAWAVVSTRPWASSQPGAQLQMLALREQALKRETALVDQIVCLRATVGRPAAGTSTSPPVRVVTLPPLTITRTS